MKYKTNTKVIYTIMPTIIAIIIMWFIFGLQANKITPTYISAQESEVADDVKLSLTPLSVPIVTSNKESETETTQHTEETEEDHVTFECPYSDYELDILYRIVEAEATGEDIIGKMLVANVVINRTHNDNFPGTIEEVVFQRKGNLHQFSPVKDGRYYKVSISQETIDAVYRVIYCGEDYSEGALFFKSTSSKVKFNYQFLFQYGSHLFYGM